MELFESIMWQYIKQEPAILKENIYRPDYDILADGFNDIKEICFIAHGSSYNSAMTVAPFFRKVAGIRVNCITSGNFISSPDHVNLLEKKSTLIVLISQTGNSRGTLQSAELAKEHGLATLGISADDSATLKSKNDYFLTLNCGEEDSNAKAKGYC